MNKKAGRILETDVLIIGSGAAGLRAAIEAKRYEANVLVMDKSLIGLNNNTAFAGGGFKAALPSLDTSTKKQYNTPEEHIIDTIKYGSYLNNQRLVEVLALEAPARLLELQEFGVKNFEKLPQVYNINSRAGSMLTKPLLTTCNGMGVNLCPHTVIYDIIAESGVIHGAVAFDCITGVKVAIKTNAIIMATGGAGEVYLRNNAVKQATGEALSIAFRTGAELIGMELVQFDPFILAEPGLPMWYVPPSKVAQRAILRNVHGEPFLVKHLPLKGKLEDPFPVRHGVFPGDVREIISRAMYLEILEGRGESGAVLLDCRNIPEEEWLTERAAHYARKALLRGFDLSKNMVHMCPGAIHNFGGIRINEHCESTIPGLFAAGESAGLVHGTGRLSGNALTDCIVFGARAGRNATEYAKSNKEKTAEADLFNEKERLLDNILKEKRNPLSPKEIKKSIKTVMWNSGGPIRWEDALKNGIKELERIQKEDMPRLFASQPLELKDAIEAYHLAVAGEMILKSALMRTESRGGGHYRLDYKNEDNKNWLKNTIVKNVNGEMVLDTVPVEITRFYPPKS